jgi:hypothetical protein
MWRHQLETGVLPDLPPPPLDVVDLLPGPIPRREDRVDVLPRAPTTAEHGDRELGQRDDPRVCQRLAVSPW